MVSMLKQLISLRMLTKPLLTGSLSLAAELSDCRVAVRPARHSTQRGQSLLLMVIMVIGFGAAFYTFVGVTSSAIERDKINTAVLAQARDALIGYAASDDNRPGSLPCPDLITNVSGNTPNDGTTDLYSGNECPGFVAGSNVYLGRLPWRTLGLPDLRDSSGERLWYAVSREFARNPWCLPNCPLSSDTLGELTVTGVAPASNVVAIIFAPGISLGAQVRDAASENTASNYLENENADGSNATFTTQASSTTFNDRLLAITNTDLMPAVERRVARDMIAILQSYKAATATSPTYPGGVYPWADRSDGGSNTWNHNRFPCGTALPVNWDTTVPASSPSTKTPSLPSWLKNGCTNPVTGWTSVVYYAVATNRLENGGAACTNCSDATLTVTNASSRVADLCPTAGTTCSSAVVSSGSADLLLITPGAATAYPRCGSPPCWPTGSFSTITGYFDDAENGDNNDDRYVVPSSTSYNRDHIYIVR